MYKFKQNEFTFQLVGDNTYAILEYHGDSEEVVIPATNGGKPVTVLYDGLFRGHPEITSVIIPDSVTDLGEFLFDGCANLHRIDLPNSIVSIWPYAFTRSGIQEIVLPDSLTTIAPFVFRYCGQLKKVVCGAGMRKINAHAFANCPQLTDLQYGPNVEVSDKAFE